MNIPLLALLLFIGLGFATILLQHFFFKEDVLVDDFIVSSKKKEECSEPYYNRADLFSAYELMTPRASCFWITFKKPEKEISINNEKIFNKVIIDQNVKLKYRKTYWKIGSKEFIIGYQVVSLE
jgi:hypothetical protein